jgi:hypothetical protein
MCPVRSVDDPVARGEETQATLDVSEGCTRSPNARKLMKSQNIATIMELNLKFQYLYMIRYCASVNDIRKLTENLGPNDLLHFRKHQRN